MNIKAIKELLEEVGEYQLAQQNDLDVEMKGYRDPVTQVDGNSESMLEKGLKKILPEADFRGEEREWSLWEGLCWVVDPLDGTKSYVAGRTGWGISVALFDGKEVILAACYCPQTKEFFHAEKGKGAFCNKKRIQVNPEKKDFVVSSFFKDLDLPKTVHDGAYYKCCMIADGRFGAYPHWELNGKGLKVWDVAAGALIVEEAGGKVCEIDGSRLDLYLEDPLVKSFFASNGTETLIKELQTLTLGL